jgi:hypothetical protein
MHPGNKINKIHECYRFTLKNRLLWVMRPLGPSKTFQIHAAVKIAELRSIFPIVYSVFRTYICIVIDDKVKGPDSKTPLKK